jgi:nucleoside-diphosphate-sugar epimerase
VTARNGSTWQPRVDTTVREVAETIAHGVGFDGDTQSDVTKPDGTPQRLLDVSKPTDAGWTAQLRLIHRLPPRPSYICRPYDLGEMAIA